MTGVSESWTSTSGDAFDSWGKREPTAYTTAEAPSSNSS